MDQKKRSHFRWVSSPKDVALVSFQNDEEPFEEEIAGLVLNESYSGCAAVFRKNEKFAPGNKCIIRCNVLSPTRAFIRWVTDMDDDALKVGFEFIIS